MKGQKSASALSVGELRSLRWERRSAYLSSNPEELSAAFGARVPWLWSALSRVGAVSFIMPANEGGARARISVGGEQIEVEADALSWRDCLRALSRLTGLGARAPWERGQEGKAECEIRAGGFDIALRVAFTPGSQGGGRMVISAPNEFDLEAFRASVEREQLRACAPKAPPEAPEGASAPASRKPIL